MLRQNQQIDREMGKEAHSLHGLQLQRTVALEWQPVESRGKKGRLTD